MAINFKKILLAGTALAAATALAPQVQAADLTTGASATWASAGTKLGTLVSTANLSDNVDITTGAATLTIASDNTADDGSATKNTFLLGNVTNSGAGVGAILITAGSGVAGANSVTIGSANIGGNFTVQHADNVVTTNQTVAITNGLTVGGALSITNSEATLAETQAVTVGGALAVTGASVLTGGALAAGGATTALTVTGNSAFTGGMTVTGGANHAGNTAKLTLNGATNTGAIVVNNNTGVATLTYSGTAAQTASGAISGTGNLVVNNATGVTFSGTVAPANITVEKAAGNSTATFKAGVTATAIKLGGDANAGDVNTVTFDGTTASFTVAGTLNGTATETDNVIVSGGKTITTSGAWGGVVAVDSVAVSGTDTVLSAGASMTSTAFTVGTGATLRTSGVATLTGTINGAGTLDVDANTNLAGIVGATTALTSVDVAAGTTLTLDATTTAYTATTTTLSGAGTGILSLAAGPHALTTNVVTATNGAGAFNVANDASTSSIVGNIGTSTAKLATMAIAGGAANVFTTTGNLYVNAITADAADTLQLIGTSAQTVSGTMTGGILIVGNTSAVAANATFSSALATIASAEVKAGATANFAAGLGAVTLTNAGTTTFSGTTASTLTGAITNTGSIFNTGTGLITTTALTNSGSGVVSLTGGSLTAGAGALTNQTGGTVTISSGKTLTAATQVAGTGTYNFGVSTTAATGLTPVAGKIVLTGGATNLTNATINVNVPSTSGFIATGTQFLIVDGTAAATTPAGAVSTATAVAADDSQLLSFTYARGDNATIAGSDTDVYLIATRAAYSTIGSTTTNDHAVGAALDAIAATGGTELDAIHGQLAAATTSAAVHTILQSVSPTVDGSAQVGAMNVTAQVQGIADTRIASIRSGDAMSGVAAGASANGWNMWLQGYGQSATQDLNDGVAGYDADTLGGAIGIDTSSMFTNGVLGFSFNYGKTNADSKNANTTDTDVDNYGFNLYGSYDAGRDYFVNGQIGYAYNDIDMARHNATGPGLGVTARANTNSDQWSAKVAVGRDFAADRGMTLTPSAALSYTRLSTDGYTETGAGAANLVVGSDTLNVAKLGIGATAAWNMKNTDGSTMKPALRVGYAYQLTNDRAETTSFFSALPANAFRTQAAEPDRSEFNVGGGLTYMTTANWDLSANYDYTYKANYDAHAGVIRATSHF